jgi:hypothetical protein
MTNRENVVGVAKAILIGSAASSAITTVGLALFNLSSSSGSSNDAPLAYLAWFVGSTIITAAVSATVGLAWHALCQSRGYASVHAYWIPGAVVGVLPGALWLLPSGSTLIAGFVLPYGAALGGLTGLFAWLIRRPDRDAANPPTSTP